MSTDGLSRSRLTAAFLGSAAAATGLLALAQSELANFNLRRPVEIVLVFLLALLGAILTGIGTAHSANAANAERERSLDAALAGKPRQLVRDRSPFDLGVRPGPFGLEPYQPRPEDEVLEAAIARGQSADDGDDEGGHDAAMVLLVGPAGAGKTRSAAHALARMAPDAILLDPVDGPALDRLLAQRDRLGLSTGTQAILWLDSLDRYFEKLDLDSLDELIFLPEPALAMYARAQRALHGLRHQAGQLRHQAGQRISKRDRRARSFAVPRQARRQITLIATIRDDVLRDALERDGAFGYVARRLTARMQIVPLPVRDSRFTHISAAALGHEHPASVQPHSFEPSAPPRAGLGLLAALAFLTLLLGGLLASIVHREGWQKPPSLSGQASEIRDSLQTCQSSRASPPDAQLHEGSQWILAISSRDCPASDMVRYFLVQHGRLIEQFNERPVTRARWSFTCLAGDRSLCLTSVAGGGKVTLGAFHSPNSRQLLPLALYRSARGAIRLYAPFLPPAPSEGQAADSRGPMTLQLRAGAAYSADPHGPKPICQHPAQLCSYPAQFFAALPRGESHPALLIAGYLVNGTIFNPRRLALRAYGLHYLRGRLLLATRDCLFYKAGREMRSKSKIHLTRTGEVAAQIRQSWTPRRAREEAVVC